MAGALLYQPSPERMERATITSFMRHAECVTGDDFEDYEALWRWSVDDVEQFWALIWEYFEVRASAPYERVLASSQMPGADWFRGAQLNYAEHVFRGKADDTVALIHRSEARELAETTWGELSDQVARAAAGMRSLGVERGDRVAAYMPNIAETVVAFLAVASIGAIWSSAAPEFGASSVIDRFAQIEPKLLIAVDGYRYGGRDFDRLDTVRALERELPGLEQTVLLPYLDPDASLDGALPWGGLLDRGDRSPLRFEQVPFDHPLWVLYSSGTTGLPKPIVHGHGGMLLEQLKKGHLHLDLHAGDRMFWFTTTGWMMWNFLVGCLLTDAAIVLYDGSPGYPDMSFLWQLAERAGITCLGTSAGFITASMKAGIDPRNDHDLSRLRSIGSTGSPLPPEGFAWVYEAVAPDIWLFSTSGGTDVCTAFVGGCPLLPVHSGELQCRALGASVEAWDEQGRSLIDEVGELVLTKPMPSMPLFFWNDVGGERYRESYFSTYPGIWRHGDWIKITPRGTAIIYGRSDSTINRQGVRMGTSEIYRAVQAEPEVVEALVVDVPDDDGDSWMPLFVVLADDGELDDDLRARIRRRIREHASPRHVPNDIYRVADLPHTLSGKLLEIPVKKILMGASPQAAVSRDSLANPEALDYFVALAERRETVEP
ncbi:MAG: acetoacetate--CoA ligase [Thermoleophilaceae bacterium]